MLVQKSAIFTMREDSGFENLVPFVCAKNFKKLHQIPNVPIVSAIVFSFSIFHSIYCDFFVHTFNSFTRSIQYVEGFTTRISFSSVDLIDTDLIIIFH